MFVWTMKSFSLFTYCAMLFQVDVEKMLGFAFLPCAHEQFMLCESEKGAVVQGGSGGPFGLPPKAVPKRATCSFKATIHSYARIVELPNNITALVT